MESINWSDFLRALALMLVFEGMLPFLNPDGMRRLMQTLYEMDNRSVRTAGFTSMLVGLALLYLAH